MKILLVYPAYPDTFWSFKYALKVIRKKAAYPPLGLLTVASMMPYQWEKKLVDLNVSPLTDTQIKWADYVFISGMVVQRDSAREVIARCNKLQAKVIAGGPLFTTEFDEFTGVDHFVLNEAEVTLKAFLSDLAQGTPKPIYTSDERPDITQTPVPMWSLINRSKYSAMNIQYSRGCPFNCEFCDIVILNGHTPRTKTPQQVIAELEALYHSGWRESILIVDDNFIGNKKKLKEEILPAITVWMKQHGYPFTFQTEASVNLSDDEELMNLMVEAGFNKVFVGIESPNEDSLVECSKAQNTKRDLVAAVQTLHRHGLEVMGGFIVGFDNDPVSIFKNQINFIQKSGVVTAMVGLLNAPRGTRLYQRLGKENRLIKNFSGDNTDLSLNFTPKMDPTKLINGYKNILHTIYNQKYYYERIMTFIKEYKPINKRKVPMVHWYQVRAFFSIVWLLGIVDKGRNHFWKLIGSTLIKKPKSIALAFGYALYGLHFRKVFQKYIENAPVKIPVSETEI
ncbi:MAG: DUF4070 domain-containing protein [Dehalococcoidales bacterium]|nr:DUF4070 domain-containing protein [Dehalococcoidales bacterium]